MRLCRFTHSGNAPRCGLFTETRILPLDDIAIGAGERYLADALLGGELERLLPTDSAAWAALQDLIAEVNRVPHLAANFWVNRSEVQLLPPIARPPKLLLLAGNYAAHVEEQGGTAKTHDKTFPYVFMKPPSTTLVGDQATVSIPAVSPSKIDHEVELAIVIGRMAKDVSTENALDYVAGYTVVNDLSDRGFHPNPSREARPKDGFFDWLHGKWHDGFCPCGPCLATVDEIPDPQILDLELQVDGATRQSGSTSEQVFGVAEIVAFLSSWVTLEPGDIISTGTPAGVGNASGKYLTPNQTMTASIESIGTLTTYLK